jgi:hypothetical protein
MGVVDIPYPLPPPHAASPTIAARARSEVAFFIVAIIGARDEASLNRERARVHDSFTHRSRFERGLAPLSCVRVELLPVIAAF